jgi:nitroreductase
VLAEEDDEPKFRPEKLCVECFHCAAVCPTDAVLFDGKTAILENPLKEIPDNFSATLENYLLSVRSCRHFKDIPVEKELLNRALELASWAPSAKNQHPTDWVVVNDESKLQEIMKNILEYTKENGISPEIASEYAEGNNVVMGQAKTILIAHADEKAINPSSDTALALHQIMLFLQANGVGSCWAGYLTRLTNAIPAVREILEIPSGHAVYGALMLGYPQKENYLHIPKRTKQRKITWI